MSRILVTAIFVLLAAATSLQAVEACGTALAETSFRAIVVAAYTILKTGIVGAFSVFVLVRRPSRRPSRDPVAFIACAAAIGTLVALRQPSGEVGMPLVLAGEVLALVACGWLFASVMTLGRCFGVLPEARGLVTRGPYGLVRHPVYLGELGAVAGLVLAAPTGRNAVLGLGFWAAQSIRMRLEERALTDEFPEYRAYAARTPRLFPYAWLPALGRRSGAA
ncbi:MAG TPA: isoprenylcysteine carboxylmethyltransferase family protein [Gaiellaceae bacterium]|jgi:protein-S-isoprenylcysteine O-methyltransferase Ste14|nr:isoprenylcysteine carboxylmethyltransferase family protein [Gaiellaceae bacterium]